MFREAARWIPTAGGMSNSWVVSGERTSTGRPILCNDPHLVPGMPSIWYAAHVRAGEDFESTGVTMPGMPFVIIGHNRRVAWGFTNSFADCQDLVIEEFDTPAGDHFRTERGFEPTRRLREIIHVKGSSDVLEEVLVTRHGPIVERIEDPERSIWRGLALQWTALQPGSAAEGLLRLQRAGDWKSFKELFAAFDAPSQNVVYADVDGHIGYLLCGRIPVRKSKPSGLPVQGWTGDAVWTRYLNVDEVPQIFDPPEHQIVTANNRIVGDKFPFYIGTDYMSGYRALRIGELLGERVVDLAYMARAQMDLVCPPARQVVRLLGAMRCEHPAAEAARHRLASWDAVMDPHRVEPTIYEAFMARLAEHSLSPVCGNAWRILAGVDLTHPVFQYPGNLVGQADPAPDRALGARRRRPFRRPHLLGGSGREVTGRCHERPSRSVSAADRGAGVGTRAPARTHPSVRPPARARMVLQRPVDQGRRQHRHGPRHVTGTRAAVRDAALRALLAPGHRRGQVGRERRHPCPGPVWAAGITPLPRPLAPLEDQPAVPAVLERAGGAPPRAGRGCARSAPDDARKEPGGRT